jgi:hypothetical protein
MPDEREGLPSASGLGRVIDCPRSKELEDKCPPSPDNKFSVRGTKIHGVMDGSVPESELSREELGVAQELRDYDKVLFVDVVDIVREQRYWHKIGDRKLWSGKLDVAGRCRVTGQGIVVNYKTGRGQDNVRYNWQAKAESVLFWQQNRDNGMEEVRYCFSQPESPYEPILCHTFTNHELVRAERQIEDAVLLALSDKKDKPLNPTEEACKWCRAVSICPALKARALSHAEAPGAVFADMCPAERGHALAAARDAAEASKKIYASVLAQAKALMDEDKEAISDWYYTRGRSLTRIISTGEAFRIAAGLGIPKDELLAAAKITHTEIERLVAKHVNGLADPKSFISDKFAKVIRTSSAASSLKQRKTKA